ncbi:MAG: hypothetical protein ACE5G1_02960 [bacterium]
MASILRGFGIDIGDIIIGDLESLGGETWFDQTKTEKYDVFVEDIHGSKKTVLNTRPSNNLLDWYPKYGIMMCGNA